MNGKFGKNGLPFKDIFNSEEKLHGYVRKTKKAVNLLRSSWLAVFLSLELQISSAASVSFENFPQLWSKVTRYIPRGAGSPLARV